MSTMAAPVEFTGDENAEFERLAARLRWRAIFMLAAAGLQGLAAVLLTIKVGVNFDTMWNLGWQAASAILPAFLGVWSFDAARSFTAIVKTEGRDRENLMIALENLRRIVKLEYIVMAIVIALVALSAVAGVVSVFVLRLR